MNEQDQEEANNDAGATGASESHSGGGKVAWFALLLAMVALAGEFYLDQKRLQPQIERLNMRIDASIGEVSAKVEAVDQALGSFGGVAQDLDALDGDVQQTNSELSTLSSKTRGIEDSIRALYDQQPTSDLDWALAEAEYLVFAAAQRLALEGDVETAIAALRTADQRLRAGEHPSLIPVREKLAEDVAALQAIGQPDIEGLAIFLAESIRNVDALPTRALQPQSMSFEQATEEGINLENWQLFFSALWNDIKSFVEIKDGALPDGVLFDPELKYFLQQNLRLELASARLAVLRADNENFKAAVEIVLDLLARHYDQNDPGVSSLMTRLNGAADQDLDPKLPNVDGAVDLIQGLRSSAQKAQDSMLIARDPQ
ncbi:MAG: uroporphyrinogen-III C-methyltransferase [Pseudomonadota bacterium]